MTTTIEIRDLADAGKRWSLLNERLTEARGDGLEVVLVLHHNKSQGVSDDVDTLELQGRFLGEFEDLTVQYDWMHRHQRFIFQSTMGVQRGTERWCHKRFVREYHWSMGVRRNWMIPTDLVKDVRPADTLPALTTEG